MTKPEIYSYSRLGTWETCEASYKLIYHDKVENLENWFASAGGLVHSLLEDLALGKIEQSQLEFLFLDGMANIKLEVYPNIKNAFINGVLTYLKNPKMFHKKMNPFYVEEEFYVFFPKGNFWLRGYIDLWGYLGNEIWAIDHKSANNKRDAWDTKKAVKQLYLYSSYIWLKAGKFPNKLAYNFFKTNDFEIIPFDRKEFNNAIEWMYDTVESIRAAKKDKEYMYNANIDDFFCKNLCGVNHACSMYNSKLTQQLKK